LYGNRTLAKPSGLVLVLVFVHCRQPACHLSGRFLPLQQLELPSQLMERLMLQSGVLARVCLHHNTKQHMPGHLAAVLADYYGSRCV
jgi:hypothetical protein